MIPDVPREMLLRAMEKFDKELRDTEEWSGWEQKSPYKYAIAHEGRRYPVKQIISMATGESKTNFSGGFEANSYVSKRGLSVVALQNGETEIDASNKRDGLEEILAHYASARANEPFKGNELRSTFKGVSGAIAATGAVSQRHTLMIKASMGQGNWAAIPWISLLDTRETETTQRGVYCVYLFREDMSGVYFALAQGVTEPKEKYGNVAQVREQLRARARELRQGCEDLTQHGFALDDNIDLRTDAALGKDYEASVIAQKFYATGSVPDDPGLVADLEALLLAYDRYLEAKEPSPRLWCIYVGHRAAGNFELARSKGIWGVDAEAKFEGIQSGDSLLFVHDLASDVSPAPKGFPRVKLPQFRGTAKLVVEATVSSDVFEDYALVWPDGAYPYQFKFEIIDEKDDVEFNDETFSTEVVNAVRRSTLAQGRPVLVNKIGDSVPAEKNSLGELAKLTNFTRLELEEIESLLWDKKQIIFEGPPGAGKTYVAELFARYFTGNPLKGPHDDRLKIVQFHQSYGYEDFVQGIRPETNEKRQLEYHVRDGIFKRLCDLAERNRDENFVIIVDEINRGNISRILGELLFLLEYRDKQVALPYSRPEDPEFSIPTNVYLLGTMNATDRSLAQIDYALRRRFTSTI